MSSDKDLLLAASREMMSAVPKPKIRTGQRLTAGLWVKPFRSDALGVNPEQVEQAREEMRRQGVDIDFDKDGRAIITSDKQYRKVAQACGMWDGQQGYHGGKDSDGNRQVTGRTVEKRKQEFRDSVARGEFDL